MSRFNNYAVRIVHWGGTPRLPQSAGKIQMNNIIKEVLAITLVVGGLYWWIDRQADQRFDRMVSQFEEKQRELEKRLIEDFRVNTDKLLNKMEEERKVTENVLEEFRKQSGASDPSGISGEFLRDDN